MIGTFANPLAPPQFHSNLKISIPHGADGKEVRQDGQHDVISSRKRPIPDRKKEEILYDTEIIQQN